MYTAELSQATLAGARRRAQAAEEGATGCTALAGLQPQAGRAVPAYDAPPAGVLAALQKATAAITEALAEMPLAQDDPVLAFHFEALHFQRLAELYGPHALFDATLAQPGAAGAKTPLSTLCVRNVIPAPHWPGASRPRMPRCFSARSVRRASSRTRWACPPPPTGSTWPRRSGPSSWTCAWPAVSTRYRDRERSLEPIVDLIASQYASRPGNYLGFLSSFDYLARVAELMRARHPQVPVWQQTPGMDEAGRKAFLGRFTEEGRGVGFAVLGGAFAEGVDLPGKRLIGAFIATLGLPQVNPVNENMRRLLDARYGQNTATTTPICIPACRRWCRRPAA